MSPQNSTFRNAELHSPLSPLSPGSPIFPDGAFTPLWMTKHQHLVPSTLISFFGINADAAHQDVNLQSDINNIKAALTRSGFKTRFAVVLLSDRSILQAPELEERLASIRRATGLDPKTGIFFLPPTSSQPEIAAFVHGVLTTLQPACIEYYRDLTKHARRKKARGYVPPPTAAPARSGSQALSQHGWNARYEYKQGVFAEFRQEMDAAERHYSLAIEELFSSEGVFETTPSWSPRWDEARLLCDTLALRVIRCQLWHVQTTGAVQSWVNYRDRMKDLIDRRGKGSLTYGWEAWEARWLKMMAQLIQRADLPIFRVLSEAKADDMVEQTEQQIYCLPEKAFPAADPLPPFDFLHHPGYWRRLSVKHTRARQKKAQAIPEEDRLPPGQSPARQVANRGRNYDVYLAPEPHEEGSYDHVSELIEASRNAEREYEIRRQQRTQTWMVLDRARDLVNASRHREAIDTLHSLWENITWRTEGWYDMGVDLLLLLRECALSAKDYNIALATAWELMSDRFIIPPGTSVDLSECHDFPLASEDVQTPSTHLDDGTTLSPISVQFALKSGQSYVGEPLASQMILTSNARAGTTSIQLTAVEVFFDDERTIKITHIASPSRTVDEIKAAFSTLSLSEDAESGRSGHKYLRAESDLTLSSGQSLVMDFDMIFREAGAWKATRAAVQLGCDQFKLEHHFLDEASIRSRLWWASADGGSLQTHVTRAEPTVVEIKPKPPKVQIQTRNQKQQYYINEMVELEIELLNGEAEKVDAVLDLQVVGQNEASLRFSWDSMPGSDQAKSMPPSNPIGILASSASTSRKVVFEAPGQPSEVALAFKVVYHLASDPDTTLEKTLYLNLPFVSPFEANYGFAPRPHDEPWPSFFSLEKPHQNADASETAHTDLSNAEGITQMWQLDVHVVSFASEPLVITEYEIIVGNVAGDAICSPQVPKRNLAGGKAREVIPPHGQHEAPFSLVTRKISLDDRRPAALELSLAIRWRRQSESASSNIVTTILPVPRLTIPCSEPRVLCSLDYPESDTSDVILQYHLENPSMHFLTFSLTMGANEDFAFSGPKYRTLSLTPLSRVSIEYRLLVHDHGAEDEVATTTTHNGRWLYPLLRVVDSYYQKTLKVQAAGSSIKADEKGDIGIWIPTKGLY